MKLFRNAIWLTRLISASGLALGLAGALGLGATAASASAGPGYLRVAPQPPNTPAVDVYLYSFGNPSAMVVLHHVGYGDVSGYQSVASGEYTVAMRLAGAAAGTKPVLSTTISVTSGGAYTVAGIVRVIQASMPQASVSVTVGARVLGRGLSFTTVTPYKAVTPGTLTVSAVGASANGSSQLSLSPDPIYTLVVLDAPGHLKIAALVDSQGSRVMPTGGAATGLGGTAARPGA